MNIAEFLREHPHLSDEEVVGALHSAMDEAEWLEWITPVLADEIRARRRSLTRAVELANVSYGPVPGSRSANGSPTALGGGGSIVKKPGWGNRERVDSPNVAALKSLVTRAVSIHADKVRLILSRELLEAEFAAASGKRVTWGSATRDDHAFRAEYLEGLANTNLDTAARHWAAVALLEERGATCLSEVAAITTVG